jgi:hypothetical protein
MYEKSVVLFQGSLASLPPTCLTIYSAVCTVRFNIQTSYVLPTHCIDVFYVEKTELSGEKHKTAWVVDGWMSMEQRWNGTDRGN